MTHLSITGADNNVPISSLVDLISSNPQLELGVLYFLEKQNVERNPGFEWRTQFFQSIPKENTALHLCGKEVFDIILDKHFTDSDVYQELIKAQRIQLNINARKDIFTASQIHDIYNVLLEQNFTIILQYHERSKNWILPFIENQSSSNIHILLDSSLGKGISPESFFIPSELINTDFPLGFAGNLNPDNIKAVHNEVKLLQRPKYWLDLESGSRTNNEFDMQKATYLCNEVFNINRNNSKVNVR
jgi:hypothetical protein